MPSRECLDTRRNATMLADCILTDGTHIVRCCECPNRDNEICGFIAEGKPKCADCWRTD